MKILILFLSFYTSIAYGADIYRTGNPRDSNIRGEFGTCLAGGGLDTEWSEGWKYLLEKARGGDVLIIRADNKRGGYENWIYYDEDQLNFPKVNSVTTIVIKNKNDANSPKVLKAILKASVVFFAGGDQSLYVDRLSQSKFQKTLNQRLKDKLIAIGGTSAGMAYLGGIIYSSNFDSPKGDGSLVTSEDVMKNPMGKFVDLKKATQPLPFMDNVVTETHFFARKREGRIVGFMARAVANKYPEVNFNSIKGIAADEGSALCFDEFGKGQIFGAGNVFFLKGNTPIESLENKILMTESAPIYKKENALNWNGNGEAVHVYVIAGSKSAQSIFNMQTWTGFGGQEQFWSVDGTLETSPRLDIKIPDQKEQVCL
jgi:cyanophycinase-like exopeptidase